MVVTGTLNLVAVLNSRCSNSRPRGDAAINCLIGHGICSVRRRTCGALSTPRPASGRRRAEIASATTRILRLGLWRQRWLWLSMR